MGKGLCRGVQRPGPKHQVDPRCTHTLGGGRPAPADSGKRARDRGSTERGKGHAAHPVGRGRARPMVGSKGSLSHHGKRLTSPATQGSSPTATTDDPGSANTRFWPLETRPGQQSFGTTESRPVLLDTRRNSSNRTPTLVRSYRPGRLALSLGVREVAAARDTGPRPPARWARVQHLNRANPSCELSGRKQPNPEFATTDPGFPPLQTPGRRPRSGVRNRRRGLEAPVGIARWMPGGAQDQWNVLTATRMHRETGPEGKKHPVSAPTTTDTI